MSCEVASSPFTDPGLGNPFDKSTTRPSIDLSAISEFNNNFESLGDNVDPLNFSNAGSPTYSLDQTLSQEQSFSFYPDLPSPSEAPYFHSLEQPPAAFVPPALRQQYLHRRSVSEPPDGALMHYRPQAEASVVFHRDGHRLGVPAPRSSYAPPAKKMKPSRSQPYQRTQELPQNRYQLRRAHTQNSPRGPTSMPSGPMMRSLPQQMPAFAFQPMPEELQYTSRVCTPAPETVDPMLVAPPMQAPTVPQMGNFGVHVAAPVQKAVVIKMGVDELRALITEVVQRAMDVTKVAKAQPKSDEETVGVSKVDDEVGDEIVVAGPFGESVVETIEQRPIQDD